MPDDTDILKKSKTKGKGKAKSKSSKRDKVAKLNAITSGNVAGYGMAKKAKSKQGAKKGSSLGSQVKSTLGRTYSDVVSGAKSLGKKAFSGIQKASQMATGTYAPGQQIAGQLRSIGK